MASQPIGAGPARSGSERPREAGAGAGASAGADQGRSAGDAGISVKLQLDLPGGTRIGPGKVRLLELIEEAGSLSRAAEAMRVSYRRAWLFVQQINQAFDEPAVATPEHGHGGAAARLTDFGKELIRRYRTLEARVETDSAETQAWLDSHRNR